MSVTGSIPKTCAVIDVNVAIRLRAKHRFVRTLVPTETTNAVNVSEIKYKRTITTELEV